MPIIRPAAPADLPALLEMVQALAHHHGDTPTASLETLTRDLFGHYPWATTLVAQKSGPLIGYATLTRSVQMQTGRRGMDLHHLFVVETARNSGTGRALIAAAIALARSEEVAQITVSTAPDNPRAAAFYPQAGFEPYTPQGARFWLNLDTARP